MTNTRKAAGANAVEHSIERPVIERPAIARSIVAAALALCWGLGGTARAQQAGPIPPPPKFEIKKIEAKADPGKPPVPADEIIERLARNEDEFKRAYKEYSFQQSVRVQESSSDAGPAGEFEVTGEVYNRADGQRYERIIKPPVSTLKLTEFSLDDVRTLAQLPLFLLTTTELPNYTISYEGQEKLDELNTYIFRVKPRTYDRTRLRFDGVVWVEDQGFAVVKTYGKYVTDVSGEGVKLPFDMYETYRENFTSKYWFPTYVHGEGTVAQKHGELRLRLVVRASDFKLQDAGAAPGTAATGSPATPPSTSSPAPPHP